MTANLRQDRAAGVVIHNEKLLVMKRTKKHRQHYTFPGGSIEAGETKDQAAQREVLEETNIVVQPEQLLYVHNYINHSRQYYFLCKYLRGSPKLGRGTIEYWKDKLGIDYYDPQWLDLNKISAITLYPLEIRDWLVADLKAGFPKKPREVEMDIAKLREDPWN